MKTQNFRDRVHVEVKKLKLEKIDFRKFYSKIFDSNIRSLVNLDHYRSVRNVRVRSTPKIKFEYLTYIINGPSELCSGSRSRAQTQTQTRAQTQPRA